MCSMCGGLYEESVVCCTYVVAPVNRRPYIRIIACHADLFQQVQPNVKRENVVEQWEMEMVQGT